MAGRALRRMIGVSRGVWAHRSLAHIPSARRVLANSSTVGRLVRRTLNGEQPLAEWSPSDLGSYEAAVAVFQRELDSGYSAVRAKGATHESVTELPRDAELVILTTAMGGG